MPQTAERLVDLHFGGDRTGPARACIPMQYYTKYGSRASSA